MTFGRTTRRWLSGWLISTLLFMQFAVAAYVCPVARSDAGQAMAGMPDCPEMSTSQPDAPQPLLCTVHCSQGGQPLTSAQLQVPLGGLGAVSIAVFDWRPHGQIPPVTAERFDIKGAQTGPPPGWPPLYLSLLVLRT
jgi:hypothetical protein